MHKGIERCKVIDALADAEAQAVQLGRALIFGETQREHVRLLTDDKREVAKAYFSHFSVPKEDDWTDDDSSTDLDNFDEDAAQREHDLCVKREDDEKLAWVYSRVQFGHPCGTFTGVLGVFP